MPLYTPQLNLNTAGQALFDFTAYGALGKFYAKENWMRSACDGAIGAGSNFVANEVVVPNLALNGLIPPLPRFVANRLPNITSAVLIEGYDEFIGHRRPPGPTNRLLRFLVNVAVGEGADALHRTIFPMGANNELAPDVRSVPLGGGPVYAPTAKTVLTKDLTMDFRAMGRNLPPRTIGTA